MPSLGPRTESNQGSGAVGPSRAERRSGWKKRRVILDLAAVDDRLTESAKATAMVLARRSNDDAKPVYGNQAKLAAELGRSVRTVQRDIGELEALGYVKVFRSRPVRGPDGRWCRRKSNSYYFCRPGREMALLGAPRRRKRGSYCVVRARKRWSYLGDSDGASTPFGVLQPAAHPPSGTGTEAAGDPERQSPATDVSAIRAAMRQRLGPRRR